MWRSSSTCSSGPRSGTEYFASSRRTLPREVLSLVSPLAREKIRPGPVRGPPAADPGGAGFRRRRRSSGIDPEGTRSKYSRRPARTAVRADPATLALSGGHGGRPDAIGICGRARRRNRRGSGRDRPHAGRGRVQHPQRVRRRSSLSSSGSASAGPADSRARGRDGRCGDGSPGGLRHGGHGSGRSGATLQEIRPSLAAGHRSARRAARPHHGR